jgi:hypothetical protein
MPRAHLEGHSPHVRELHPRPRIEVDAQLIGVLQVGAAHRVRVQLDAAQVHDPGEASDIVHDDLLGGAARGERERHRPQPARALIRRPLLVKRLGLGPVDEPLQDDRAVADSAEGALGHRDIVLDDIELREARLLRKIRLARVGDGHLVAGK